MTEPPTAGVLDPPSVTSTQVWFGPVERPLYGWLSVPPGHRARGGAVLCAPMGEEGRATHRTWRRLAEELAAGGIATLRFDYDGTGDSAGEQDDPDRVAAWLASIEAARQLVADLGVDRVAVVGMRLGATLAATVAAGCTAPRPASSLVLWDPCLSGRTFLREGEALLSFADEADLENLDPAYRHTPGFQYDHATARAMRTLDVARLPTERPLADRVLLLTRDDRPAQPAVVDRLALEGDRLTRIPALDQDLLLDLPPSDNFVPERTVLRVARWLIDGVADQGDVALSAPPAEHDVEVASCGPGSPLVRERSVRLGPSGLYGISDEPLHEVPDGPRAWVVLVNVAAEHHIGPGRWWVQLGRRWAALGYRCVRMDQSGIGDSPLRAGQTEDAPFSPEWITDMREVVGELGADGSPVILVGLCSGAYSSLEAAMWERVTAIFAVNPRLTLYPATKGTAVYTPLRRAGIVPTRPFAALARTHRILAGALWRIYRQVAVWHAPFRVLRGVVRRGTVVHVVACRDDAQHFTEVLFWKPGLARLRRDPRFSLEEDEIFDHSLLGREGQIGTADRATAFLADLQAPAPAPAPAPVPAAVDPTIDPTVDPAAVGGPR